MNKNNIPFDKLYEMDNFNNYYDHELLFKHFWRCSLYDYWKAFDFDKAFDECIWPIKEKLTEHGLTTLEEYQSNFEDIYGNISEDIPDYYVIQTDYLYICKEDIHDIIIEHLYNKSKKIFENMFDDLITLADDIENRDNILKENIVLFDRLIHAEHVTGLIFDINIDELREDVEEEYKEYALTSKIS